MPDTPESPAPEPRSGRAPASSLSPEDFSRLAADVEAQVRRVIVGQHRLVRDVLAGMLAGGHILLEGVPGLGKTVLVRALASSLSLDFTRVQCTPDLMPADIVGTTVLGDGTAPSFQPGPVFTQLLLADEVNRATPKTQSALLEAMAEHRVTVGGVTRDLPAPFSVLATQNPIEMEGTYPLPEAQLDRFLVKILVELPSTDDLIAILERTTGARDDVPSPVASAGDLLAAARLVREVPIADHVTRHAVDLVQATHPGPDAVEPVRRYVHHGASPRGAQALVLLAKTTALLAGRLQASVDDVREVAGPCLRHRLVLGYEAMAAGVDADAVVDAVLDAVGAPATPLRGAG